MATAISLSSYNKVVTTYTWFFKTGKSTNVKTFCSMLSIPYKNKFKDFQEQKAFYSKLGKAVVQLNHILSSRGMRLRTRNYYTEFYLEEVSSNVITNYKQQSQRRAARASELATGLDQYDGQFVKYSTKEFDRLISYHRTTFV